MAMIDVELAAANLSEASLIHSNLSNALLQGALIHHASLFRTNLSGAHLSYYSGFYSAANISFAIFNGCNLSHADLRDANLYNKVMINITSLDGIILNKETNFRGSLIVNPDFIKIIQNNFCKIFQIS
jgi:uncharacterized protein YjbI with pentapeptide repeats